MAAKKKQHIVPKCYSANFTDNRCPSGQAPYVWVVSKFDESVSRRAPKNLLTASDIYTVELDDGTRSLILEDSLANIESKFASLYREVLQRKATPNVEQRAVLATFMAAMLLRTLDLKESIDKSHED